MEKCHSKVSIPNKVCYVDRCDRKFCYRAIFLFLGHSFYLNRLLQNFTSLVLNVTCFSRFSDPV